MRNLRGATGEPNASASETTAVPSRGVTSKSREGMRSTSSTTMAWYMKALSRADNASEICLSGLSDVASDSGRLRGTKKFQ